MHDFKIFEIFFIAKSDTLRSNTPFLLNDDYQEVSIWPLNKPLKMAKWGFWFEHVIFLYKNAWFSSRQRRKKYFSLLPGFCTKMHDFFFKSLWLRFVPGNRGPEARGSQKRLVWKKNAILNMARPMKNSGTLPCMTFAETAFKGHNRHSKSLNKQ